MRRELLEQLRKLRQEISSLKSDFDNLNNQKEGWFSKKRSYSMQAAGLVKKIKELRAKRDELTSIAQENKRARNAANEEIKSIREEIKKLKDERSEISKKHGVRGYKSIIDEISKIESDIEIEVIPFEQEKKMMQRLHKLRETKEKLAVLEQIENKVRELNSIFRTLKRKATEAHTMTKTRADESQVMHNQILEMAKQIEGLDMKKEEAMKQYLEVKNKFHDTRKKLKEKIALRDSLKWQLDKIEQEHNEKMKKERENSLNQKEAQLQEKMLKGGKITTSDLLLFQESGFNKK